MRNRLAVVVPVHDEQDTLRQCLDALVAASSGIDVEVHVVVVLDACSDRSAAIADSFAHQGVRSLVVEHRSVGAARAAGFGVLMRRHDPRHLWLATTDADTRVPRHWLSGQLRHVDGGARVIAGTVEVDDWGERSTLVRERAQRAYGTGPHRHVHGANLSFAADAYLAAGGFRPIPCHEDIDLVDRLAAGGEPITWATDLCVTTSARRKGRAPNGFADYLTSLEVDSVPRAM